MRGWITLLALSIAACDGGKRGDDDDGANPPPGSFRIEIDAGVHANETALFRVRQGNDVVCISRALNGSGAATITTGGMTIGNDYDKVELVLNVDGNGVWDDHVDHVFNRATALHASASSGQVLLFDHDDYAGGGWQIGSAINEAPNGWSWSGGQGCPGS